MKTIRTSGRTTLYGFRQSAIGCAVALVSAFAAFTTVIVAPSGAWAGNAILLVSCTPAYPTSNSWEITAQVEANKANLDRKWLGVSINVNGRWVDLNHFYLVSPQENANIHQGHAAGIKRQMTWRVKFQSRDKPQASARAVPTFGSKAPSGYGANPRQNIVNARGYPWLSALDTSLNVDQPFHIGHDFTIALWQGGKNLARVNKTGCP